MFALDDGNTPSSLIDCFAIELFPQPLAGGTITSGMNPVVIELVEISV